MQNQEIQALTQLLEDEDNAVRHNAILALGKVEATVAVPTLIKTLHQEKDNRLCRVAINVLANIGQPAIPSLISALHDQDTVLRRRAGVALGQIGDPEVLQPLIDILQDDDVTVRQAAVVALSNLGTAAVLPLIIALQDDDEFVQLKASLALIDLGHSAVKPLIRLLPNRHLTLQRTIIEILEKIGEPSVKPMISLLGTQNPIVRHLSLTTLKRIGSLEALLAIGKQTGGNVQQNYAWLEGFRHQLQPDDKQQHQLIYLAIFFQHYTGPILNVDEHHLYQFFSHQLKIWDDDFQATVNIFRRFFAFVHHHTHQSGLLNPVSNIQFLLTSITVLLIGFDDDYQRFLETVLKPHGVTTIYAIQYQIDVVRFCQESRPDAIFAYNPDSITVYQHLKGDPTTENICLILFHNKAENEVVDSQNIASSQYRPDGEIQCPFAINDLLIHLHQIYRAVLRNVFLT